MFNKKRLFIFIAFIILLFFMMTFASQPGGVRRVNTREVKFIDGYTKQVISTQTIEVGKNAEVPESPVHDNCKFSGWYTENDVRIDDFTNITTNLTVYSGCAVNYYTVRFYDTIARRVIDTQTVRGGEDASAPTAPTHEGYTFVRWSGKYTNVSADVRVDAIYNANAAAYKVEYYTVKDDVATLYTTKNLTGTVNSNASAEIITIEGYTYDETNTQNVLSGAIASDGSLVLKVYYAVSNYTVTIDPNCTGEKCDDIKEEKHEYGDEITLEGLERKYTLSYKEAEEVEKPNQPQEASAEFQGYCINARTCSDVITAGTVVEVKDNVTYYAQWNETALTVDVAEGHNYQTTTTDFTFLYWLDGSKQVEANSKITLTGDKELVAKYDNGTARKYTLTINYVYEDGSEAATTYTDEVANGTTYNVTSPEANKAGYHAQDATVTGTMPAEALTLSVTYVANTDMPYTVEHYKQNVDGTYPDTASETENKTDGVTDQTVTATPKEYTGFTQDTENQLNHLTDTIDGTSNIVLKVYYKRDVHTVTVTYHYANNEHPDTVVGPDSYRYEESYSYTTPEVAGYSVNKTTVSGTMGTEDVTETVTYTASSDISYKIEHYKQNVDGSYPDTASETENKTDGVTDQTVTATPKEYEGFTYDAENQLNHLSDTVTADGNLILKVYYKRDTHTVTVTYIYANNEHPAVTVGPDSYRYEQSYSYTTPAVAGYSASKTTVSGTMGLEDVTETVTYTASTTMPYTVEHYQQNLDGSYPTEPTETENKTDGVTDQTVTATPKEYEGFTVDETVEGTHKSEVLTAGSNVVLKLFYKRDTYTITIDPQCEDTDNTSCTTIIEDHPYGDTITLNELSRSYTLTFSENSAVNPQVGSIPASAEFQGYCLNSTDPETCTKVQAGTVTVTGPATYNAIWNEAGLHVVIPTGGNYTTETEIGEFVSWKDTSNAIVNPTNDYFVTKSDTLTANYTNKYTLTITYKYADGTEAAPAHTEVLVKGSAYNVTSPTITGYNASPETVSGTITANVTTEVEYSKKSLSYTVNFYYDDELNNSITDQKADFGTVISYSDYTIPENMKVDMEKTNPTSITIGEDVSANVLNIYYKTTSVELSINVDVDSPRDPAEYNDVITITVTAKNVGDGSGKVVVKDSELAKALNPTTGDPLISIDSTSVKVNGETSTDYNALDILSTNGIVIDNMQPNEEMVITLVVRVKANAGDTINSKVESQVNDGSFTTESTNAITVEKTLSFNKITEQYVGTNVVIALDASGSMLGKVNRKTLLKYAQEATESFIKNVFPNSDIDATHTNVVVLKYGSKGSSCHYSLLYGRYCDVNTPFAEQVGTTLTSYANRQSLINSVNGITIEEPSGTPYYVALEEVNKVLYTEGTGLASTNPDNKNVVVFLTDGAPDDLDDVDRRNAAIAALHADGKETIVYAVALGNGASGAQAILNSIAGDSSRVITTGAEGLEAEFKRISIEAAPDPNPKQTHEGVAEIGTDLRVDADHKLTIIVNRNTASERTIEYTSISAAMTARYLIQDEDGKYDIDATKFDPADTIYVSFYGNSGRGTMNRAATRKFGALYGPSYEGLVEGQVLPEIEQEDATETDTTDEVVNNEDVIDENTTPVENTEETKEKTTESEEVVNETTTSETEIIEETENNEEVTNETVEELPQEILPVGDLVSIEAIISEDEEEKPVVNKEEEIPATKEEVSTEVVQEEK